MGVVLSLGTKAGFAATPSARQTTSRRKSVALNALNARSVGRKMAAGAGRGRLSLKACGCEIVTSPLMASSVFSSSSSLPYVSCGSGKFVRSTETEISGAKMLRTTMNCAACVQVAARMPPSATVRNRQMQTMAV